MKFEHFLITRFNIKIKTMLTKYLETIDISSDEKYLDGRIKIFETFTVPSVINQSCKNFSWVIMLSDNTPDKYKKFMSDLSCTYSNVYPLYIRDDENVRIVLNNFMHTKKADWYLTSRLDNDDAIARNYVEFVQNHVTFEHYGGGVCITL